MLSAHYQEKLPCTKCGELCYKLCYVGKGLVCVDCFHKACDKAKANKKPHPKDRA